MKKNLLIVVDMQNDFITGVLGTDDAKAMVDGVAAYINNFDGDVIFTQDTHDGSYTDSLEGKYLPVEHTKINTKGWEIVPKIQACKKFSGARVFQKGAFGSQDLFHWLSKHKDDYMAVYFVGVKTGICVISNVVLSKTAMPEVPVFVVSNLCACVTSETHETALNAMRLLQCEII